MIKFQIIIDKKGFEKKLKTTKSILGKMSSDLALILSVVVLSTIIGLGIHLVLAYTNPSANPPGDNVEGPINVSDVAQTKEGRLEIKEGYQKDYMWGLSESGIVSGAGLYAVNGPVVGKDIVATGTAWVDGNLQANSKIYAPNQNREHEQMSPKYKTSDTAVITCPSGKFLYKVQIHKNGVDSQGWCAAPFIKMDVPVGGGGGGDVKELGTWEAISAAPGAWEQVMNPTWWFLPGAY